MIALAGPFEREAIRPFVTGNFSTMLRAAAQHPAMLVYLDQFNSAGPESKMGQRRNRGLNENLAREILELHTLSSQGGYSQNDVTEFARALTGWTVGGLRGNAKRSPGEFYFNPAMHEPGSRRILGRSYTQRGAAQGEAILSDLALHPATAQFLAFKLARHFIADEPPQQAVDDLAQAYIKSKGHLPAVYAALIDRPEMWTLPAQKFKSPEDFLVSTFRGLGFDAPNIANMRRVYRMLGQTPFQYTSPLGWPDKAADWAGADALKKRIEWANLVAGRAEGRDPGDFLASALGPIVSEKTRLAVSRAESKKQGLTLALMSPEFQRR